MPSSSCPRPRAARGIGISSAGRILASAKMTAPNDAALMRKTGPVPTSTMRNPASAGPMTRPRLNDALLSPTALARSSRPTISMTKDCRAGASQAAPTPSSEGQHVDVPDLHDAGDVEHAEDDTDGRHEALGDDQDLALRVAVGERPGERGEHQHRQELQAGGDAERDAAAGRRAGAPASPGRPAASRCRCSRRRRRWRSSGSCGCAATGTSGSYGLVMRSRSGAAARSTSRSSWVSSASRRDSQASRRRRSSRSSAFASGGQGDEVLTAVGRVRGAGDEAALLEAGEGARHRRRLHVLVVGQLARRQRARAGPAWRARRSA